MKKNIGSLDRLVRFILAALIAVLYFTNSISGIAAIVLGIIAIAFVLTSMVGSCPLYSLLGIGTNRKKKAPVPFRG